MSSRSRMRAWPRSSNASASSAEPDARHVDGRGDGYSDVVNQVIAAVLADLDRVILGKPQAVRLAFACLIARGHLLIEDVPGVGKTTLAHALAHVLGLAWQRVQFTSDLLPADIIGVSVFDA